jgi:hypothetical protein
MLCRKISVVSGETDFRVNKPAVTVLQIAVTDVLSLFSRSERRD